MQFVVDGIRIAKIGNLKLVPAPESGLVGGKVTEEERAVKVVLVASPA